MGVETVGAGHLEGPWGEEKVVVVVMPGAGDWVGAGVCPVKPKTECNALGIDWVWRPLAWVVWRAYRVRRKCWWW